MENISIIIPVHNEEESVIGLAEEVESSFKDSPFEWEVIWVNDGSRDSTRTVLEAFLSRHHRHEIINLPKQCGQSAAVLAGIQIAKFELIGTLDGDGQNV